jgi:hypothetical protein
MNKITKRKMRKENKGGRRGRRIGWPEKYRKEETRTEAGNSHSWCDELPKCFGEVTMTMMITHESS